MKTGPTQSYEWLQLTGTRQVSESWGCCSLRHAWIWTRRWRGSSPAQNDRCRQAPPPN